VVGFVRGVALIAVLLALVVGCSGDDGDLSRVATATAPSTSTIDDVTTTTETPTVTDDVAPPPLTHAMFIRRLDRICKRGNRAIDRSNKRLEAAFARGDYDAAADIWARTKKRLDPPFYAKVRALVPPSRDEVGLRRYLELSRQLDVLEVRSIRALRQGDDAERARLDNLMERLSNRRTLVTSRLGLTECGG
jgi:hypothetical protein